MRKEIIFAVIAGGLFGLVIAFGIWRINSALKPPQGTERATETSKPQGQSAMTIAEPSENDVLSETPAAVTGLTNPNAFVSISSEEKDYLVQADNKGAFSGQIALLGGANQIVFTSFDTGGTPSAQTLTIIYSTEFAKLVKTTPTSAEESTDSVRLKVQQKVDEALNSPTSYLGTVTDIAEVTIQLKSASGEIQQVSTSDSPTVIKDGKTPKEVKIADVAIGDYIIAMGYRNGNHVLTAKRILITTPLAPTSRKAITGEAVEVTKSGLSIGSTKITLATGATIFSFDSGKSTKIKFSTIEEGNKVIALGESTKDGLEARTIFLLNTP